MAISEKERREKVLKFETFVNETLKSDLKTTLEERDKLYEEIAEYLSLKNSSSEVYGGGSNGSNLSIKCQIGTF